MAVKPNKRSKDFENYLIPALKNDSELASEYINAAMEDDDIRVFLLALGHVAKARGMSSIAKKTGLNRENIYRIVSTNGNPEVKSLFALLNALGLKLKTVPATKARKKRKRVEPLPA